MDTTLRGAMDTTLRKRGNGHHNMKRDLRSGKRLRDERAAGGNRSASFRASEAGPRGAAQGQDGGHQGGTP